MRCTKKSLILWEGRELQGTWTLDTVNKCRFLDEIGAGDRLKFESEIFTSTEEFLDFKRSLDVIFENDNVISGLDYHFKNGKPAENPYITVIFFEKENKELFQAARALI